MDFIDAHCHLDYFKDEEIENIIRNARASRSTNLISLKKTQRKP